MSLQGTLRTLGIAEVLEFLAGRSATGRLEITADTGHATYWVSSGEIASVDYSFARESGTDAAEATYYALAEVDGTFHFDEDQRPEDVGETEAISDVLARTADTADGWSYVEEVIATPQHCLRRSETLEDTVAVQPEWWVAIAAVGEGITPQRLAQSLDMRALAASTMASDMVRAGLLEVDEPRAEQPEAAPTADELHDPVEASHDAIADAPDDVTTEEHAEVDDQDGLNLFGAGAPPLPEAAVDASAELDELVSELEHQSIPEPETAPAPLAVVEPIEDADGAEDLVPSEDVQSSTRPEVEPPSPHHEVPASPALVWDAEAAPEAAPAPAPTSGDWDDDDGWATDHSQPAAVSMGVAEDFHGAPAAADVFGAAPAIDPSTVPAAFGEGETGDTPDDYATDDRSSVLKFLRRD